MRYTALSLLVLANYLCLFAQAFHSEDLALKLKMALSNPENADSLNEISDESVNPAVAFNNLYGKFDKIYPKDDSTLILKTPQNKPYNNFFVKFDKTYPKDDSTLMLKTPPAVNNPENVGKIKKIKLVLNNKPVKSEMVVFNKSYGKFAEVIPKDDSMSKLKTALNNPENADNLNEISRTFKEAQPVQMGVIIIDESSFEKQKFTTIKSEITTTSTTTEAPTDPEDGRASDYEQQANNNALRRRMLGFLSSWMQIRHLLRLAS